MKCEVCGYRIRKRALKIKLIEKDEKGNIKEKFIPSPDRKRHWWCL